MPRWGFHLKMTNAVDCFAAFLGLRGKTQQVHDVAIWQHPHERCCAVVWICPLCTGHLSRCTYLGPQRATMDQWPFCGYQFYCALVCAMFVGRRVFLQFWKPKRGEPAQSTSEQPGFHGQTTQHDYHTVLYVGKRYVVNLTHHGIGSLWRGGRLLQ